MRLAAALCLLSLSLAAPARAWNDEDGKPDETTEVKDHPMIPRFPKSVLTDGEQRDFNEFDLPVKWVESEGDFKRQHVEGRYTRLVYENYYKSSATEIARNYVNALTRAGFKTLVDYKENDSDRTVSAMLDGKGKVWVYVHVYGFGDTTGTELVVVEGKQMEQKIALDAAGMLDEINKSGHVAVYGINFATGKSDITPDSAKVLGEIGKLLAENPALKLRVEGHTDNVGKSKDNLALSKKRAEAVRAWLTKNGVDAKRLTSDGFGDSRPVADNGSDDGRAQNRRVELVKL